MVKFNIGFWNYTNVNVINIAEEVKNWVELGITTGMSFLFNEKTDKAKILELLDECQKYGISVILSDERTSFRTLMEVGEECFIAGVKQAVSDFAAHPATFGFLVGDEPDKNMWEYAVKAYNIVKEADSAHEHLLNFYPYVNESADSINCSLEYFNMLDDFLKRTGCKILSYDYYGQCNYFDRERWLEVYFINLHNFYEVAKNNGAQCYTSLLSVGHWGYRVPSDDDLRWQISTAFAHGYSGILWFYIYQHHAENYRLAAIDPHFKNKSFVYDELSRQNRIFNDFLAPALQNFNLVKVEHYVRQFGGYPAFSASGALKQIKTVINEQPFSVSYFVNDKGEQALALVNLSQTLPSCVQLTFEGEFAKHNGTHWIAPGQMHVFTKDKTY